VTRRPEIRSREAGPLAPGVAAFAQKSPTAPSDLGQLLPRLFFEEPPELVAPRLLGKLLVHLDGKTALAGRIVETEAYLGPHNDPPDPAAHSHRGPTPRNRVLFGHAGFAYVYAIYGRYFCMNVSCEREGQAGGVLFRALEPVLGIERMAANRGLAWQPGMNSYLPDPIARQLTSGPSRLCLALGIERTTHNGLDLTDPGSHFQIRDDGFEVQEALVTPRIGISDAVDWPLRFAVPGQRCVSGPKSLAGRRILIP
jgi:DNA-3-methyladenine glycosylase